MKQFFFSEITELCELALHEGSEALAQVCRDDVDVPAVEGNRARSDGALSSALVEGVPGRGTEAAYDL